MSYRTDNNPDGKVNPPLMLRFKNESDGILITINIETEPYSSHIYRRLMVRWNYSDERKDSSYEVVVALLMKSKMHHCANMVGGLFINASDSILFGRI